MTYQVSTWILAWLVLVCLAVIYVLAGNLKLYVAAFKRTATQLYNVTGERDKLHIQNAGLKQELTRECVKNERLEENLAIDEKLRKQFSELKKKLGHAGQRGIEAEETGIAINTESFSVKRPGKDGL